MVEEEWRSVSGYEGRYEVSDLGNVRSLLGNARALKASPIPGGYLTVGLYRDGVHCTHCVHALVARAFLGVRPIGYQVNHKSTIKADNALSNLEYLTPSANRAHSFAAGNESTAGENSRVAKLTNAKIAAIRELVAAGKKQKEVAAMFGITQSAVSLIKSGARWRPGALSND